MLARVQVGFSRRDAAVRLYPLPLSGNLVLCMYRWVGLTGFVSHGHVLISRFGHNSYLPHQ